MSASAWRDLSCRELVELVTDYLEDRLPPEERTRFELHVGYCGGCRVYLDQIRALARAAGRLTEESIPAEARQELLQAFRSWKSGTV